MHHFHTKLWNLPISVNDAEAKALLLGARLVKDLKVDIFLFRVRLSLGD